MTARPAAQGLPHPWARGQGEECRRLGAWAGLAPGETSSSVENDDIRSFTEKHKRLGY